MDEIFLEIKEKLYKIIDDSDVLTDEALCEYIDECIYNNSKTRILSIKQREELKKRLFNSIRRLDVLQELLEDDSITEIMINGYKNIFIEKNGTIEKWNKCFESNEKLEDVAQRIAARSNRAINQANPIVDTRLSDGSRVNIVLAPVAINGTTITIRKFYEQPLTIERLIELGSITEEAAEFLRKLVVSKYNIFISGGTGSGKTTFLNALSNYIPEDERVITIEDSAELQLRKINNLVSLEVRNSNISGENGITIRDLIKSSLRMRPDRIVVGEVRAEEALDMLQAMNTGHDGSLSTGHSNSPSDMLSRLETMVLMGMQMPVIAIRQQIASAIDIIVHLKRMRDKTRKVVEITEVKSFEDERIILNPIFKYKEQGEDKSGKIIGCLEGSGENLKNTEKLLAAGIKSW